MIPASILAAAEKNIHDILTLAMNHDPARRALLVYDERSSLSKLLTKAYRALLPGAAALDFDQVAPEDIWREIRALAPKDLVVLIQSSSFRLNDFRVRIELFNRDLKVIEHPHLARMLEKEFLTYINALAYDPSYYRSVGPGLKRRIDRAGQIKIICHGTELVYQGPFEEARLNIGDYRHMKNVGGLFPIGEVFTEPEEIRNVNGEVLFFAFGDKDFSVSAVQKPFSVIIRQGIVADAPAAPPGFLSVLEEIEAQEEKIWVRELGFGLNRALTPEHRLTDISAYERMCGIHLSLGAKHALYPKPGFPKKNKFHVDVFASVERVEIDGETVFRENGYVLEPPTVNQTDPLN